MKLLNAVTADTTGIGKLLKSPVTVYVDGTIGGGTVSIQTARDVGGEAGPYAEVKSMTATGRENIFVFGSYYMRAVLSGATNPILTVETS